MSPGDPTVTINGDTTITTDGIVTITATPGQTVYDDGEGWVVTETGDVTVSVNGDDTTTVAADGTVTTVFGGSGITKVVSGSETTTYLGDPGGESVTLGDGTLTISGPGGTLTINIGVAGIAAGESEITVPGSADPDGYEFCAAEDNYPTTPAMPPAAGEKPPPLVPDLFSYLALFFPGIRPAGGPYVPRGPVMPPGGLRPGRPEVLGD